MPESDRKIFTHYLYDHYSAPFPIDYWWETFKLNGTGIDNQF
jgi:hypothetical protein